MLLLTGQKGLSICLALYGAAEFTVSRKPHFLLRIWFERLTTLPALSGCLVDDSISRQLPFLLGLIVLGGATTMLCIGNHVGLSIVGRMGEGASTTMVLTVRIAFLVDTVGT